MVGLYKKHLYENDNDHEESLEYLEGRCCESALGILKNCLLIHLRKQMQLSTSLLQIVHVRWRHARLELLFLLVLAISKMERATRPSENFWKLFYLVFKIAQGSRVHSTGHAATSHHGAGNQYWHDGAQKKQTISALAGFNSCGRAVGTLVVG